MAAPAYVGVRVEGGLLPAALLGRLADAKTAGVEGLSGSDYGLAHGESVREAANRVWAYLRTVWTGYRSALADLPASDRATTLTRERWLLIVLDQFGYGRLPAGKGLTIDGKQFPISHGWGATPIHLLGERIDLDRRTAGVAGAAGQAPQSMVQELLNRSDEHLWALLSNGSTLRLLRDSTSLVGSAYVEFDLEAIFEGELFSDFLVMFTLVHATRLAVRDDSIGPNSCWLETWRTTAVEAGSRALDQLRIGVVEAIETLGTGFLAHPANTELRARVESDGITLADYNHALLRVIYRLLFTFVAEDRAVLLDPAADSKVRQRYVDYFSTDRLRRVARARRGGRHGDRWQALNLVWTGLGSPGGHPELGLVGLGGLYEHGPLDFLADAELSNEALLAAVRSLSLVTEKGSGLRRVVDYRGLDSEELGSIYESLLEYVPQWDAANRRYHLGAAAGNSRKTTGSYYTPTSLIETLLDSALDPVIQAATQSSASAAETVDRLLQLTVCDPACGSGHFLVGAARRIAKAVAAARTGDPEPPPEMVRAALRDVIGTCIYGVDINPLAAELAKVSLWLEAMEPGRPLAFLDAHVRVGNSLVGATPALLNSGLPQEAFKPIEGDDKKVVSALAKRNKDEGVGQGSLFESDEWRSSNAALINEAAGLGGAVGSVADAHVQQQRLKHYVTSDAYRASKLHADAWCAAFVWPKVAGGVACPTNSTLEGLREGQADDSVRREIERLASEYRFFHWHLEFPHLFPTEPSSDDTTINPVTGWYGGFSVVLGNPPWERVKLQEQEFFASRDPEIANAPNAAARKRLIKALPDTHPTLHDAFVAAKRRAEGESHILRNSGRYPLAGRGDVNTYSVFAELDRTLMSSRGRVGVILPLGIATDATTQWFFKDVVRTNQLSSIFAFREVRRIFIDTDDRKPFCLLTMSGMPMGEAWFAFSLDSASQLARSGVKYTLTPEEINLLNPNTGTCPVFRSRRDAEITLGIYRRIPVLINQNDPENGNPWGIKFMTMFHMSNDSHLFHTRDELEADGWTLVGNVFERQLPEDDGTTESNGGGGGVTLERLLPLYEAKMIHHYDIKWATYEPDGSTRDITPDEKLDPEFYVMPRYWVYETEVDKKLDGKWDKTWMLGWRDIARATDERTFITAQVPRLPYGHKWLLGLPARGRQGLQAAWSSFVFDYAARQKIGGTSMGYFVVNQLPTPSPDRMRQYPSWVSDHVDRLNSQCVDGETNCRLRAELDGLMFHVYGVSRDDADYIMETFPIVKRKDVAAYGEYRTKHLILEAYDRLGDGKTGAL